MKANTASIAEKAARRMRRRRIRRILLWIVTLLIAVLVIKFGHSALHLARVYWNDRDERRPVPAGSVDDASRLNQTPVQSIIDIPRDPAQAELQLQELIARARKEHLKIAIAGARHSLGGHSIYPGGIALNMLPFNAMTLDKSAAVLHVGAGARWADILPFLDAQGFSVAVMQSFNDFSVGGSLSVNAHGQDYAAPPIASTALSFHIMTADGKILRCSRTENPELFSLALGGYGLFGIILDADLQVVPNARYHGSAAAMPTADLIPAIRALNPRAPPAIAFARLSIAPSSFMREAVLTTFYPDLGPIPAMNSPVMPAALRTLYRGEQGSDYGKELRWNSEKEVDARLPSMNFSRNQLLNTPFAPFENRTAATTDILHEYFLPADDFTAFIADLKTIVPTHTADLLNATVRDIRADNTTFLKYADTDVIAVVLLLVQPRDPAGEADMQSLTRALIDSALLHHGRYYLPYRLHATPEQFHAAYPMADNFFNLKRKYDPDEIFQNEFYVQYGTKH